MKVRDFVDEIIDIYAKNEEDDDPLYEVYGWIDGKKAYVIEDRDFKECDVIVVEIFATSELFFRTFQEMNAFANQNGFELFSIGYGFPIDLSGEVWRLEFYRVS